jgi:small subunit ribosomal protein S20
MANHLSAKKATKQADARNVRNRARKSSIKTSIKAFSVAVSSGDQQKALEALRAAQSLIAKGAKKSVLKKNTASRRVSSLTSQYKKAFEA